jgi:6-pyruvoyltetrahydropterin 2'-reductase
VRQTLPVAETFYSIQGEGPTAGVPAVFLRTSYCNLRCPGWGPAGAPQGCDTGAVWRRTWAELTPRQVIDYWSKRGWLRYLSPAFRTHLVLTGGEPLLWQRQLTALLELLKAEGPYVEVETNATLRPLADFDAFVTQYNCSPKLASAGNPLSRANRPDALSFFAGDPRAAFKFVVQEPAADLYEILEGYVERLGIAPERVWLMPEAATRERLLERSAAVMELAKRFGFRFSSRLHLIAWDQATGV